MSRKLIKNPDDIRLTEQHEIEAIMGNPPGRLLTSGNFLFLGGILLLLALGAYLPYPDVVEARAKLVSDSPPIRIVPLQSGRIIHLPKEDQAEVAEGELLGVIENSANWEAVLKLEEYFLNHLKTKTFGDLQPDSLPNNLNLGELQTPYAVFINNLETAWFNAINDRTTIQLKNFQKQIDNYENSKKALSDRQQAAKAELMLYDTILERNLKLRNDGLLSQEAYENFLIEKNQKEQRIIIIANQKAETEVAINQLEKQKIDLSQRTRLSQNEYDLKTVAAFESLKGAIHQWKKNYLLLAPTAGKVSVVNLLTINQFVQAGVPIMTVVPTYQSVYGIAQLGQENIGEISLKDSVKIKLAGFPYYDYGTLQGNVEQISSIPENELYTIKIVFPTANILLKNDSLKIKTSYNEHIPIRQEMEGIARIITEENTYLGRIYNRLRGTFEW